jgi:esterase/lipase
MKNRFLKLTTIILVLFLGISIGLFLRHNSKTWSLIKKPLVKAYIIFFDTQPIQWSNNFKIIEIKSSKDGSLQKSYFYKSQTKELKPLIVSLHTWSGNYNEYDELAEICKKKDLNYIHPDFRGANQTLQSCCSELALADIDDAITYAIKNSNVDTSKIYVIGVSGGGYATLSTFMKSKHNIKKFSSWAPITDLISWYKECEIRNMYYTKNILDCTGSTNQLNLKNAKLKSPIYWNTPIDKLKDSKLYIYAGIYDGSVPITHSINFYNKLLNDLSVQDTLSYISPHEKLKLLEKREPLSEFGTISGRKICLKKAVNNISLTIFEGNHEMLSEFALNELLQD